MVSRCVIRTISIPHVASRSFAKNLKWKVETPDCNYPAVFIKILIGSSDCLSETIGLRKSIGARRLWNAEPLYMKRIFIRGDLLNKFFAWGGVFRLNQRWRGLQEWKKRGTQCMAIKLSSPFLSQRGAGSNASFERDYCWLDTNFGLEM